MQTKYFLGILMTGLLFGGCTTIKVSSDYDRQASFSNLKSYDWVSVEQPKMGDPRIDNTLFDSRVRESVDQQLAAKSYERAAPGTTPDFLVAYHASISQRLDVTTFENYHYPAYYHAHHGFVHHGSLTWPDKETYVTQYDEGTLLIDIINPTTQELIWRGTAQGTLKDRASIEQREARIDKAVRKILAQFPPL